MKKKYVSLPAWITPELKKRCKKIEAWTNGTKLPDGRLVRYVRIVFRDKENCKIIVKKL